ncbi:DNA polymerase III subunit delta' [Yersinia ruckeri]|uniref:DNA polymerase III subunit delta' n=1 Tax=Yersinia ruckeri TaxID=29486 RepID=UPI0008FE22A4|nr:DNA polymerase III subunit delta' [Yersinia ruckeri]OJB99159.1 DNA polymerase III subunit delta' [Yersinia ruckeri]OJC02021.1 DNA polymerase III subunit delta' [Yersinia ruckeri]OJC04570.1 DNA polymerase III subunit delta' [Yersinia ruckeri]
MNWYPWLNAPYRQLVGQHIAGRGHHALLVHALPGNGADALIYGLSRWLMCQQRQGEKSCGECHSCRLMLAGNHPDWHVLTPEKGKSSIGVERVRTLIETLYSHAQQGGAKVIWLPQAESLTDAAANALLKTLEEPPEKTYFLLRCVEPSRLLPTLRSRCFYWHFSSPETALSMQWLGRQVSAEPVAMLAALQLSEGGPIAAEQLLQPERWAQRTALCQAFSEGLSRQDLMSLLPQLNHDNVSERLHWLSSLLLDALKWQQGAGNFIVNQDQRQLVQQLAQSTPISALLQSANQWLHCRHQLSSVVGVNRELLLTEQLLNWENRLSGADRTFSHSL